MIGKSVISASVAALMVIIAGGSAAASEREIIAFIDQHCIECHDNETRKGKLSLEEIASFKDASPELWSSIRELVQLGEMPPKKKPRPSGEDQQMVVSWIADSLTAAGNHVENKLDWPNYGNYIDHEALFRGDAHPAPATRVRIWRKRPEAYAAKSSGGIQPFSMVPGQQISDFSALYIVDESSAEIVLRNAQQLIESRTQVELKNGEVVKKEGSHTQSVYLPILHPDKAPDEEQFNKAIEWQFVSVIDRKPTEEELVRVRKLYEEITEEHGRLQGARAALTVPLLMPESLYRLELGSGELDEHGRRRLTKPEIINALHQTLSGKHLHRALHEANRNLELGTKEEVASLVRELLSGDKPNERLLHFFDEYFDYEKATGVFKEVPRGVHYNASTLVQDARKLIYTIVSEDRDVFRRLLTISQTPIAEDRYPPGNEGIYGLPGDWKWRDGMIDLPKDQRAGILTHPAWLVAHSGNFDNDPVRRGKWIRERLLGGTIPDLPISVDAVVPEDDEKTLRERYEKIHSDSYCWKCHEAMNPLGMPFENFDHLGRYRLKELKKDVVTSGAITESGDPAIDGPVKDPIELIHRIANSKRAQEVFVRYAFRFFLGRNETERDARTLREANAAYEKNGGSMVELVVSLLSSDSFLFRAPEL